MQKNLLILWACEALKVTHRLPTWPKTSRMNKLHKLRQPARIVSANWIVLSACPRARAPRWMRRTTEAGLRIHHGTLLNLCNFSSSKFWSPFSLPHLDFLQSRSRHLQVHIFLMVQLQACRRISSYCGRVKLSKWRIGCRHGPKLRGLINCTN